MSGTTSTPAAPVYGVTPTGFVKMRMIDCQSAIVAALNANFAALTGDSSLQVDTTPNSITGQLIATICEAFATLWEMGEGVYNGMYPVTASDISLDNAVSFSGVTRLNENQTIVPAILYGDEGTAVASGFKTALSSTGQTFSLEEAVVITAALGVDVTIEVTTVVPGSTYAVIINSVPYQITSALTDGASDIIGNLANALVLSGLNVSYNNAYLYVKAQNSNSFSMSLSTNLDFSSIGCAASFVCDDFGPIDVEIGDLDILVSSQGGLASVNNVLPGVTGRYTESDTDLRNRYQLGVYQLGGAVLASIQARLTNNVNGIQAVTVIPNNSDNNLASGQTPHSIECIVQGGSDLDVAQQIFLSVAGGIGTYGTTTVVVNTASSGSYPISFSRPEPVYIWAQCITQLLVSETFPANGLAAIASIIASTGNALGISGDVVIQRFFGPIFTQVSGLAGLNITIASNTDPTFQPQASDFSSSNLLIGDTQIANFDLTRISVT